MKLLYKLLSGYLILALLVLITDGVSRWSYRNLEHTYHRISSRALPHIQSLEKAQATVLRMVASTSEYALFVSAREEQRHQPHEEDDDAIESSSPTFRAGDRERKEIHPRVKINLPIISSLLKMQARKITDPNFVNSQNRVKYKALIHESLYPSSALSQIDVDDYWRKPASLILRSYNLHAERIRLN
ncbi:MAG TPA: histidine kinase dimerization/phosphoacceptor domain -containing protein, partial [Blastocatellia bacterium]|nr:histidine kinase dimerization/phosphoacceptor domain -containing protein [Blastocatellia bacterium]